MKRSFCNLNYFPAVSHRNLASIVSISSILPRLSFLVVFHCRSLITPSSPHLFAFFHPSSLRLELFWYWMHISYYSIKICSRNGKHWIKQRLRPSPLPNFCYFYRRLSFHLHLSVFFRVYSSYSVLVFYFFRSVFPPFFLFSEEIR